ncbi:hypothetical protein Tco_1341652, partial [Tanacetum coccineum]
MKNTLRRLKNTKNATMEKWRMYMKMAEAFKRAAESLEKLLDVTSQEITQGVKSSTRAVRLAEERLRRLTNMNPSGFEIDDNLGRQVTAFQLLSFMKIPK